MASCTSCKYCTEIGSDEAGNAVKRRCTHSMKNYEDYVEYSCRYYTYDSASSSSSSSSSSSDYKSSSSDYSSSSGGYGKYIAVAVVIVVIALVAVLSLTGKSNTKPTVQGNAQQSQNSGEADGNEMAVVNEDFTLRSCGTAEVTPIEGLHLRTGPDTLYESLFVMSQGKIVTVYYLTNGWAYSDMQGTKGWCYYEWLDMSDVHFDEPSTPIYQTSYVKADTAVGMYIGKSENAPLIVDLAPGTELVILQKDGSWAYIEWDGYRGWCPLAYLG